MADCCACVERTGATMAMAAAANPIADLLVILAPRSMSYALPHRRSTNASNEGTRNRQGRFGHLPPARHHTSPPRKSCDAGKARHHADQPLEHGELRAVLQLVLLRGEEQLEPSQRRVRRQLH